MFDIRDPNQVDRAIMFADEATIRRHRAMLMPLIIERYGNIVSVDPIDVPLPSEAHEAAIPGVGTKK